MTPESLIAEGRRLARPCLALRFGGSGPIGGVWLEYDPSDYDREGGHFPISVEAKYVPGLPAGSAGFFSVFLDSDHGGRVELGPEPPRRGGRMLRVEEVCPLPPPEVVFARGSAAVGDWLARLGWPRDRLLYDADQPDFPEEAVAEAYMDAYRDEHPLFGEDPAKAVLGGWPEAHIHDEWYDLLDEPFVLGMDGAYDFPVWVWRLRSGEYRVIQGYP